VSTTPRARRTLRWTALAALTVPILWVALRSVQGLAEAGPAIAANRWRLALLTLAIVVLAVGFVGVLIRNLVQIILDRKRGILGSRLRTKLVFFFLVLVLLPALLLSWGAAALLKGSVDTLLETPVKDVTQQARALVDAAGRREEARAMRLASRLVRDLAGRVGPAESEVVLAARLESFLERLEVQAAAAAVVGGAAAQAVTRIPGEAGIPGQSARTTLARIAADVIESGQERFTVEPDGDAFLVAAGVPWRTYDGAGRPRVAGAAVVASVVSRELAARMDAISAAQQAYDEFRGERREILRFYYSLIALIGLATVFVASWIGMRVARRISDPIQEVAAATREIAGGNLGVRVRVETGDEVGLLVDAFNDMAAQLQESRDVITRSTADLRRSNQALEERRRYVETLIASLSTGVLSLDRTGRVTTSNPAMAAILGAAIAPGEELRAKLAEPGLAPLLDALDAILAAGHEAGRRELVLRRRGEPVAVSAHVIPLRGARGEDLGTLLVVEDLTDLLRAQKALAWQEVARRVAHEIKNPLTPIQLSAQRLRKKFDEGAADLPLVVESATASIEQEVSALKRLVDEFSRYARMPEPSPEPVDVATLVESVLALYRGHGSIRWETRIDPGVGIVRLDREQMRRVLINLLDNAVAAVNGSGWIGVFARPWRGSGSLRLEVEDDGPGIPPGLRDRLFEPYFSTKRRGSGLGLAIVHRIVTEHRGAVGVEDGARGGVRFVVEIPGDERAAAVPPTPGE
jgi:two-component system nitrogen regulation sensor histidine kinase NtrY